MKTYLLFAILIIAHLAILTQLQFTAWPEMLSYPYLLNNGFDLYKDIALPYQPVLIFLLSIFYKIFGYSIINLKIFTWGIILLNDLLLFLIVKKILNIQLACLAVFFYLLIQVVSDGNMLWFDLAATLFILSGLVTFFYSGGFKKYMLLGLFFSLATLSKQQVALTVVFAFMLILFSAREAKKIIYFSIGAVLPVFLVVIYVLTNGILRDFIFWAFEVPLVWYPKASGYVHLPSSNEWIKVALISTPVILTLLYIKKWNKNLVLIFLVFIATLVTSFPRFEFFRIQPSLPLIAILAAFSTSWIKYKIFIPFIPIIFFLLFLPGQLDTVGITRFFSDSDLKTKELINLYSGNEEKIYLLGLSSSLYIYSDKLTSKPWVDNYNWYMEIPGVQQKVIDGLQSERIKYIFRKLPQKGQWFDLGSYEPKLIIEYILDNYYLQNTVGDIQIWIRK